MSSKCVDMSVEGGRMSTPLSTMFRSYVSMLWRTPLARVCQQGVSELVANKTSASAEGNKIWREKYDYHLGSGKSAKSVVDMVVKAETGAEELEAHGPGKEARIHSEDKCNRGLETLRSVGFCRDANIKHYTPPAPICQPILTKLFSPLSRKSGKNICCSVKSGNWQPSWIPLPSHFSAYYIQHFCLSQSIPVLPSLKCIQASKRRMLLRRKMQARSRWSWQCS